MRQRSVDCYMWLNQIEWAPNLPCDDGLTNCVCTWYSASSKYWTLSYLFAFLRRLMFQFKRQTSLANNVSATSLSLFDKNADGKSIKIIRLLKRTPRTNWVRLAGVKLSNLVFYWTSHKWYSTHRGFMSLESWYGAPLCLEMMAKLLFQFGTQYTFMTNDYKKCRFLLSICTSGFWIGDTIRDSYKWWLE